MSTPPAAPLQDFSDCHRSILDHLGAFAEMPALLEPATRARRLAQDMLALFDEAVLAHHADEERELFPSVLASAAAGAEREQVQDLIDRLTAEHRSIEAAFKRMAPELRRVAKGQDSALEPSAVQHLVAHYQAHARFEEAEFLPLAQAILSRNSHHLDALDLALHLRHGPRVVGGYL